MNRARVLLCIAMVGVAAAAFAHPLGNNTVNRQSGLIVGARAIEVHYLMDLAEIPALVESQSADRDGDGTVSDEEWQAHAERWAEEVRQAIAIHIDGRALPLAIQRETYRVMPGEAGLTTLRFEAVYAAPISAGRSDVRMAYRDDYRPERKGWREIYIRAADGARIDEANVPAIDRSKALSDYSLPVSASAPNEHGAAAAITFPAAPSAEPPSVRAQERAANIDAARPIDTGTAAQTAWAFFKLGIHHIATGWDHLVFLFGLLLITRALRELVKVVTAFTVAHSITLALASAGWVTPPAEFIEPAIALTIAYVGWMALPARARVHGAWLAFAFGLVHGFGFAGALAETLGGQAHATRWLVSLASFNLGIEAFQVALVCALVPLMRAVERASWSTLAYRSAAVAVVVAGAGWFVGRALPFIA